ncbi:hypothetical protein KUTeg_004769 [Tegillarca granosa]|uniref:Uncharacterized protein n=1 Tax=Tegillarca granosa TaxID=220873 RepID=A0ABQ9FHT8_TEGGR|nr:hypothetical protein KUTeg_004769 [Tegillarca granosa]
MIKILNMTSEKSVIHDQVKDYYGKQVQNVNDLQTAACVAPGKAVTKAVREAISAIHDDVAMSGRDCFALSKLVGKDGFVTGIDMTEEQEGGELYFSDIYANKDLPDSVRKHEVLWGDARFVSVEYRLFKLPKKCDQTSSQVIYNGEIPGYEDEFVFDFKTSFKPPSKKSTNDACCKVEQK